MRHWYVERPGDDSHGSWSVGRSGRGPRVLVQLTDALGSQTRIALEPQDAMGLAGDMVTVATAAMEGRSCQLGNGGAEWMASTGTSTAPGITDEVLLELHDEGGTNGNDRTRLALPIGDALEMVEEIARRTLETARERRADHLSRRGRSPV